MQPCREHPGLENTPHLESLDWMGVLRCGGGSLLSSAIEMSPPQVLHGALPHRALLPVHRQSAQPPHGAGRARAGTFRLATSHHVPDAVLEEQGSGTLQLDWPRFSNVSHAPVAGLRALGRGVHTLPTARAGLWELGGDVGSILSGQ